MIQRPNPDDFGDLEQEIEERLTNQNARKLALELEAIPGQSLEPDEETRNQALVAARNGEVVASGKDPDGVAVSRSTSDHPVIQSERYDPDIVSERNAFMMAARALLERIRSA